MLRSLARRFDTAVDRATKQSLFRLGSGLNLGFRPAHKIAEIPGVQLGYYQAFLSSRKFLDRVGSRHLKQPVLHFVSGGVHTAVADSIVKAPEKMEIRRRIACSDGGRML